ncbi:MAG: ABC transporter substrate-binding protein [Cyclobacteriaceae bacterium]
MIKKTKTLAAIGKLFLGFLIIFSCSRKSKSDSQEAAYKKDARMSYANQFSFEDHNGFTEIRIPVRSGENDRFFLFDKSLRLPDSLIGSSKVIPIPVRSVVCTSTTQLPWFDVLESAQILSGFPDPEFIYSPVQRERFRRGELKDLGGPSGLEPEALISLGPDLILSFSSGNDDRLSLLLNKAGIPLLSTREHLEEHPLGRAEWIRFAGLLLDKRKEADSIFNEVVKRYNNQLVVSGSPGVSPTVITGIPYGGVWYLPGSRSYASRLFSDAGFKPIQAGSDNATVIPLSIEEVFQTGLNADFWIGASDFSTLNQLIDSDSRYSKFKAVRNKNVWVYDRQLIPGGGNGYFESAGLRPDLVLNDLNRIRTGTDTATLTYYRRLK